MDAPIFSEAGGRQDVTLLVVSLPTDLRRRAFATAYFLRLSPPPAPGEHEPDLLAGLDGIARMG